MKLFKLIKLEYKRYFSNKILLIFMTLLPLLLSLSSILFFKYISNLNMENSNIAIVNNDLSDDMDMLMAILKNTDSIKENGRLIPLEYDEALDDLKGNKVDMVIVIPYRFTKDIYTGNKTYIEIIENENSKNKLKSIIFKKVALEGISLGVYAQKSLDIIWNSMDENNYSQDSMTKVYNDNAKDLLLNIAGRNKMFDIKDKPTHLLYYFMIIFVLFIYISGLLVFVTIKNDSNSSIINRLKLNNYTYNQYILSKFVVSISLQLIIYGIPIFIFMTLIDVLSIKSIIAILLISLCSNIVIFFVLRILKRNSWVIIIYSLLLCYWLLNRNNLILNPVGKSVYLLIDIFSKNSFEKFNSLLVLTILLCVTTFSTKIKFNYFIRKLKGE